jgi:hypothetical protein
MTVTITACVSTTALIAAQLRRSGPASALGEPPRVLPLLVLVLVLVLVVAGQPLEQQPAARRRRASPAIAP